MVIRTGSPEHSERHHPLVGSPSLGFQFHHRSGRRGELDSCARRRFRRLVKPGEDFEEPLMMITGPLVYCIFANICYTFGWIVDAVFYMGTPRTRLYKSGLIFSVVLTALPGVWAVMAWLITVYTGRKLD